MTRTILCADDSATIQHVAQITFSASDFEYIGARSADEAMQKARESKPALILADAVMPGKTGYDLCQEVKSDPSLSDVPVLVMCGNSQAYDAGKGQEVGADGHVTKPWDTQQMLDKLTEVLGKAGAGVAKPAAAAAAKPAAPPKPAPAPAAKPTPAPAPAAAAAKPSTPPLRPSQIPQAPPGAPRSATLMGLPSVQLPPKDKGGAPATAAAAPSAGASDGLPTPGTRPASSPGVPSVPSVPPVAARPSRPMAAVSPAGDTAGLGPAGSTPTPAPAVKSGDGAPARSPMISGTPSKPKVSPPRPVPPTVEEAVKASGLDPNGPEVAAVLKLSRDVIERIVWEVVPDLAETIIRENLDRIAPKR